MDRTTRSAQFAVVTRLIPTARLGDISETSAALIIRGPEYRDVIEADLEILRRAGVIARYVTEEYPYIVIFFRNWEAARE